MCSFIAKRRQETVRNNGCPQEIMEKLGGWTKFIRSRYGSAALLAKQRYFFGQEIAHG